MVHTMNTTSLRQYFVALSVPVSVLSHLRSTCVYFPSTRKLVTKTKRTVWPPVPSTGDTSYCNGSERVWLVLRNSWGCLTTEFCEHGNDYSGYITARNFLKKWVTLTFSEDPRHRRSSCNWWLDDHCMFRHSTQVAVKETTAPRIPRRTESWQIYYLFRMSICLPWGRGHTLMEVGSTTLRDQL
jgi:hypothetical protein